MKKILTVILLIFITLLTSGFTKIHNDKKYAEIIQKQVLMIIFILSGFEREVWL